MPRDREGATTSARVRGIYATALTAALRDAGVAVVAASPPIRERFEAELPTAEPTVRVWTTADRQGVEVSGPPDAAETVADAVVVGVDTLRWRADAPRDAVFRGRVTETKRGGAVVDLGAREGYLPFSKTEADVDAGDALTVQVEDPVAPWRDGRPVLRTDLRVTGALATLERGVEADVAGTPSGASELAEMTGLLSTDVPEAWGVRWERDAPDAGMEALGDALALAAERAAAIDDGPGDAEPPSRLGAPLATHHLWFGRETRAVCDDLRADVATTMAGHHRVKAGSNAASDAVDLVEGIGNPPTEFPFGAVTDTFGPREGDTVAIEHGKPEGRVITLGRAEVVERSDDGAVTLRREMGGRGTYDGLGVDQESGDVATTKAKEARWWYPTTYRDSEGNVKGTYCNVCTPVEVFPDAVRYVDLHVDVVRHADGAVEVLDEDELAAAETEGLLSAALADRARDVAEKIASGLR